MTADPSRDVVTWKAGDRTPARGSLQTQKPHDTTISPNASSYRHLHRSIARSLAAVMAQSFPAIDPSIQLRISIHHLVGRVTFAISHLGRGGGMSRTPPSWREGVATYLGHYTEIDDVITICSLLSNRRRQYIIFYLLSSTNDEWVPLRDVAQWATAVEHEYPVSEATGDDYRNMRESMRHTHVDTLADANVIEYNSQGTELKAGDCLPEVARILIQLLLMTDA